MADFKLCISDPKTTKAYQKEVKGEDGRSFIGMKIGDSVKGELLGLTGYELQITGGSDFCGFPMRRGILGIRKKITISGGVGFRGIGKGIKRRKTVCGHKINENIVQINLKVIKEGTKKLADALGVEEKPKEEKKVKEEKVEKKEKKEVKAKEKKELKEESKEKKEEAKEKPEKAKEKPKEEAQKEAKEPEKKP